MAYVPNRGDIVPIEFDPASGREMKGPHFGLVLSGPVFNRQGLAMICPISQGAAAVARTYGTVVSLMGVGAQTQGAVHCHQLKSLNWRERKVRFKEAIPQYLLDEVLARVEAILFE
jgi:mRNA interferase ChpB